MQETNKPREFFDYAVLDLGDIETINAAIASLPTLDRVCLNAGVVSHGLHKESGVNNNFVSTLGHAKLVEGLIAAGKIGSGSRVIYIGTEFHGIVSQSLRDDRIPAFFLVFHGEGY